ncbi:MAG: ampG [Gammaproteobacteria bacterium]|jgi:PAT family beta-lactamase induction signal transducer AmpG|nr:ampG [Gammaproteobacteria bacterium]
MSNQKPSFIQSLKALTQPRLLATTLLAFSSGLPLALTGSTLQAWYTVAGVSIVTIGVLSLVGQPYTYKFLWAPLLDRYTPAFLGRRRGWVLIFQFLLAVSLAAMAFMNPVTAPWLLAGFAFFVAFLSASQDIAIDAYRADLLNPNERAMGAAVTTLAYRIAMLLSGAVAMILADQIGWKNTYLIMAALMASEMLVTWRSPEPDFHPKPPVSLYKAVVEPFKEFLGRKAGWLILIFVMVYKLSDVVALSLSTAFLLRGLNFTLTDVGVYYKTIGLTATVLGSFIGAIYLPRMGFYRALMWFGILQGLSNFVFVLLAVSAKSYALMIAAIFVENLCGGLSNVAMVALLMALCNAKYTATQFALLSALSAVGRVFVGPFAGLLVEQMGWAWFFTFSVFCVLPALVILVFLKPYLEALTKSEKKKS